MSILYFILVLFVIVLVHEYGHYKTAKLFGVRVDEFGFGYPPKVVTLFKRGETTFTLNALPFGGFVKIYGEDATTEADTHRALFSKPKWQQMIILVAGVVMNVLLAWVIFLGLFLAESPTMASFVDQKYLTDTKVSITEVISGSVAETAGLHKSDTLLSLTGANHEVHHISSSTDFINQLEKNGGDTVTVTLSRNGNIVDIPITPAQTATDGPYKIGVGLSDEGTYELSFTQAVSYSFKTVWFILKNIFLGLFDLIKSIFGYHLANKIEVSGPVGIVKSIGNASQYGFHYLLSLTALISLNLAALNVLPIPALDGGRLLFLLVEKIKGSPINIKTATMIHTTSFFILVSLMLIVTFFDVAKLFR